ncbi:MAG: cupin domain-containing protein [Maritimibacter sp.]|nr:cupin domain-containing protein [Maritimibacter sp.]
MTKLDTTRALAPGADWPEEIRAELFANEMNGRVGQDLLSETDTVRIWRIRLAPGERVGFHRHVLNYFWVAINAGRSRSHYASGETREAAYGAGDVAHFQFAEGEYMLHDLTNIGETELIFTTVEFKTSPNAPLPV